MAPTRNLTGKTGVHDRNPKWSPDGKSDRFISRRHRRGRDLPITAQDGSGTDQATHQRRTALQVPALLVARQQEDHVVRQEDAPVLRRRRSKKAKQVAKSKTWEIRDYAWSPDSKWIAYARPRRTAWERSTSTPWSRTNRSRHRWLVRFHCAPPSPATASICSSSPSATSTRSYSATEWNHAYVDMARIYFVTLAKDTPFAVRAQER